MTWSEQHQHARHWVFRELDRLIEERSRTERKEPLHGKERDLPRLARLRALLIGLLRQARPPRARKRNPTLKRPPST